MQREDAQVKMTSHRRARIERTRMGA